MGLLGFLCQQNLQTVAVPQTCNQQQRTAVETQDGLEQDIARARATLSVQPAAPKTAALAAALQASAARSSIDGLIGAQPWRRGSACPLPSFSSDSTCDPSGLLNKASLPDVSFPLPVVSQESLQGAFGNAYQAIAVVRLSPGLGHRRGSTCDAWEPASPLPAMMPLTLKRLSVDTSSPTNGMFVSKMDPITPRTNQQSADERRRKFRSGCRQTFILRTAPQPLTDTGLFDDSPQFSVSNNLGPLTDSKGGRLAGHATGSSRANSFVAGEGAQLAQLEPVFMNDPLKRMLAIKHLEEYSYFMDTQLRRNPMMVMVFENSVRRLMAKKATSVRQYYPYFSSPNTVQPQATTNFLNLCITTCGLLEEASSTDGLEDSNSNGAGPWFLDAEGDRKGLKVTPALFLWYDDPSRQAGLTSQLKRDYMALSHIPSMVTVVALDGRVLHQNGGSVSYMGFLMGSSDQGVDISDPSHTLRRLFALEPEALDDMLVTLADNKAWHAIVCMPSSLDLTDQPPRTSTTGDLSNSTAVGNLRPQQQQQQYVSGGGAGMLACQPATAGTGTGAGAGGTIMSTVHRGELNVSWNENLSQETQPAYEGKTPARAEEVSSRSSAEGARGQGQAVDSATVQGLQDTKQPGSTSKAAESSGPPNSKWHQVQASKFQDPVSGEHVIMLIQTDATARIRAEQQLRQVLDAEHAVLESIFPRQVLETMTAAIRAAISGHAGDPHLHVDPHPGLLAQQKSTFAMQHEQVSIMFADIVGFTTMAKHVEPVMVMTFLNDLYTRFDALLSEHQVYKVETIGDCYMVAGGLVFTDADGVTSVMQSKVDPLHAQRVFNFAKAMLATAGQVPMPDTGLPVRLRVGIHSGPVVSGVVGTRMPRFCLFGDTVNTANRMESTATPNSIHVSDITQQLIGGEGWEATGGVQLKGRGMMESYIYALH